LHSTSIDIYDERDKKGETPMQTTQFVYWEKDGAWLGHLHEYPDYWTQGESLDDLKDHLRDLYADLTGRDLPALSI